MRDEVPVVFVFMAVILFGITGLAVGIQLGHDDREKVAATTSCAQYHPDTGKFEWLEP